MVKDLEIINKKLDAIALLFERMVHPLAIVMPSPETEESKEIVKKIKSRGWLTQGTISLLEKNGELCIGDELIRAFKKIWPTPDAMFEYLKEKS